MKTQSSTPPTNSEPDSDWFNSDYPSVVIIVLMVALLLGVSASTLRSHNPLFTAEPPDCAKLIQDEERLGCYDHAFHRLPLRPPRGSNVPLPGAG
jgi:hypothetical protein